MGDVGAMGKVPGGGWIVNGADPQGATFALYHEH
jgi:predicted enzyme related to lactoylglutathione lyase